MRLLLGDSLHVLRSLPAESIDSVVTDPPYGLAFMGSRWDYDVPSVDLWREVFRVLKPGGHLLAFAGTRTQHRMAVNIEDAGFEIRDMIAWVYGSGFPKSHDVSKAIDRKAGAERERYERDAFGGTFSDDGGTTYGTAISNTPVTLKAKHWEGWGTALKPALEPITVARKPLIGTVATNVQQFGTGAINIDGCRVGTEQTRTQPGNLFPGCYGTFRPAPEKVHFGRWPANLIHDGSDEVVRLFPETSSGSRSGVYRNGTFSSGRDTRPLQGSTGSAARFFYCAKASPSERSAGLEHREPATVSDGRTAPNDTAYQRDQTPRRNIHPTVKPIALMCYLVRLVTQPGGTVLDPFLGSGTTGIAAALEGFDFVGIEREPEYLEIAQARIAHWSQRAASSTPKKAPAVLPGQLSLFGGDS